MSKQYKLFIDESGHPHRNDRSKHFVLVGIIIQDGHQEALKIKADQLRFKYWDRTDVVLHSEEIGKRKGEFAIFQDQPQLGAKFERQFLHFLGTAPVHVTTSVVDKERAYRVGWKEETIVNKANDAILLDYLAFLYAQDRAHGRVAYETSTSKRDALYLNTFYRLASPNWQRANPDFQGVRGVLTSVTFANKLNDDIEIQLADIFSYAAICKYHKDNGSKTYTPGSYEAKLIKILEKKLLVRPANMTNPVKRKYYQKVNGVTVLPPYEKLPSKKAKKKKTD